MSKYIEVDALIDNMIDYVVDGYAESPADFESYEKMAQTAPSIDIVHCRECKHSGICFGRLVQGTKVVQLNFCSYGEREGE